MASFFISLLGIFSGLAVAYLLAPRKQSSTVQILVPSAGEHFVVRLGTKSGEYFLDVMDNRGIRIKTPGVLRPGSVARAATLPPALAAALGALNPFDRFELDSQGTFVATTKEEGYQIFPFVV